MTTAIYVENTSISALQLSEFFRLAGIPGSHVDGATFQAYLKQRNPFETISSSVSVVDFQETELLKPRECIRLSEWNDLIDPSEFFSGQGTCLSSSFQRDLLPALRQVVYAPGKTLYLPRMERNAIDSEIRDNLPKEHLISWVDLARFIRMYPQGRDGYFLCYMRGVGAAVFTVDVYWRSGGRKWSVSGWELDEGGYWSAGYQILYPGNAAL